MIVDPIYNAERTLAGKCMCGAVEYAVTDSFQYAMNCHCSNCRRVTGSAFKPFAGIERDRLRITRGSDGILIYGSEAGPHDVHCATCGSLLYSVVREAAYVHVTLGTLIDDPPFDAHLCRIKGEMASDHGRSTSVRDIL